MDITPLGELLAMHSVSPIARPGPEEDEVWEKFIAPSLPPLRTNVAKLCSFGFLEMMNNAIDHSGGWNADATAYFNSEANLLTLMVVDNGVGLFEKVRSHYGLADLGQAVFELSKGKVTTAPSEHSGTGVFFVSRLFDSFSILANQWVLARSPAGKWLADVRAEVTRGTTVVMKINLDSERQPSEVFDMYAPPSEDYEFTKTQLILKLAKQANVGFMSRSEARRMAMRLEEFREVWVDFEGVEEIYPPFADELFRVFADKHPDTKLSAVNANDRVLGLIKSVEARRGSPPDS